MATRLFIARTAIDTVDWEQVDEAALHRVERAAARPTGPLNAANDRQYVRALMTQGVPIAGCDVYAFVPDGQDVLMYGINDDPDDWPGDFHAWRWRFGPPEGDRVRQHVTFYAENPARLPPNVRIERTQWVGWSYDGAHPMHQGKEVRDWDYRPWSDFTYPPKRFQMFGVWDEEAHHDQAMSRLGQYRIEGAPGRSDGLT